MTVLVPGGSSPGHWAEAEGRLPAETLTGWVGVTQRAHPRVLPTPRRRSGLRTALAVPEAGALVWGHGAQRAYLGSFDVWSPGQAGQGTNCSLLIEDDIGISSHRPRP